ncbi:hypothetical protein EVAR_89754_1 [Eumeta japonica]|uniref:Uncharacterized protein n=1 Tax=Eumeta variegata TaxID=151549 RepID=A0A4C1SPI3_EUMVA|nr:hypothetical protein EVAR_89754_1 [Eumeta japonica]
MGENECEMKSVTGTGIENEAGTKIENDTRGENKCRIQKTGTELRMDWGGMNGMEGTIMGRNGMDLDGME